MNERKCPECGAAFLPQSKTQVCCSKECQKKRRRRLGNESESRRRARQPRDFRAALRAATPISTECIMNARRKPANCSAVRWRIELRRRQNPGYYALLNEL